MRHFANERVPKIPQKMPVDIAGTPTLSGENAPQACRDINRTLCLPLVSESKKVIWVNSEQVEQQLKEQPELENAFEQFPYLTANQTAALAQRCSLHPDQVKVWFMAKRLEYGISWDCEDIHEVSRKIRGQEKSSGSSESRSGEEQSGEDRGLLGACEAMQPQRNGKKGKLEENETKIGRKKSVVKRRKKKQTLEGTAKKATNPALKFDTDEAIHTRKLNGTRKRPVSKPSNESRPLTDDPLGDPLSPGETVPANPPCRRFGESKQVNMELKEESKDAIDWKGKELIEGSVSHVSNDQTTLPKKQREKVPRPCKNPSENAGVKKTTTQLLTLKKAFLISQYPTSEMYCQLNEVTGLSRPNLVNWFKDMRYYAKKKKPGWMTKEQHKQVLDNIMYRQCIDKITTMEKQENV